MSTYDLEPGDEVISNIGEKLTVLSIDGVMGKFSREDGTEVELQLTKVKYLEDQEEDTKTEEKESKEEKVQIDTQKSEEHKDKKSKAKNHKKDN